MKNIDAQSPFKIYLTQKADLFHFINFSVKIQNEIDSFCFATFFLLLPDTGDFRLA